MANFINDQPLQATESAYYIGMGLINCPKATSQFPKVTVATTLLVAVLMMHFVMLLGSFLMNPVLDDNIFLNFIHTTSGRTVGSHTYIMNPENLALYNYKHIF